MTMPASESSHRPAFTIRLCLSFHGTPAYVRDMQETVIKHMLVPQFGTRLIDGFVGDVEFTGDDLPELNQSENVDH